MITNRELAILIWITIFLIYCLLKKEIKKPLINLIKSALSKKLIKLYIFIYTYIFLCIYILYKVKFWNIDMLKDTIVWSITIPIFSVMKAQEDWKMYFKETLKSCFEIYILIEFIGINYPFSVRIELIIIPIILLFSLVGEFAEKLGGTKEVSTFAYCIVIILSLISFIHSIKLAINDVQNIFTIDTLKNIIIIPILTIIYMPITYLIVVFMNYETFLVRIKCKKCLSEKDKRIIMFKAIKNCKLNLNKIKRIKLEKYIDIREY